MLTMDIEPTVRSFVHWIKKFHLLDNRTLSRLTGPEKEDFDSMLHSPGFCFDLHNPAMCQHINVEQKQNAMVSHP